jgi:hypothetical protein
MDNIVEFTIEDAESIRPSEPTGGWHWRGASVVRDNLGDVVFIGFKDECEEFITMNGVSGNG